MQLVAALPGLPADDGSRYSIRRLTASWLLESLTAAAEQGTLRAHDDTLSPTVVSHHLDLYAFLSWCDRDRVDPLHARASDLGLFRVWRELHGPRGRVAKPATVARAIASISSWYRYLQANSDTVTSNPAAATRRPKVSRTSSTVGLTPHETDALIAAADAQTAARQARWHQRRTRRYTPGTSRRSATAAAGRPRHAHQRSARPRHRGPVNQRRPPDPAIRRQGNDEKGCR